MKMANFTNISDRWSENFRQEMLSQAKLCRKFYALRAHGHQRILPEDLKYILDSVGININLEEMWQLRRDCYRRFDLDEVAHFFHLRVIRSLCDLVGPQNFILNEIASHHRRGITQPNNSVGSQRIFPANLNNIQDSVVININLEEIQQILPDFNGRSDLDEVSHFYSRVNPMLPDLVGPVHGLRAQNLILNEIASHNPRVISQLNNSVGPAGGLRSHNDFLLSARVVEPGPSTLALLPLQETPPSGWNIDNPDADGQNFPVASEEQLRLVIGGIDARDGGNTIGGFWLRCKAATRHILDKLTRRLTDTSDANTAFDTVRCVQLAAAIVQIYEASTANLSEADKALVISSLFSLGVGYIISPPPARGGGRDNQGVVSRVRGGLSSALSMFGTISAFCLPLPDNIQFWVLPPAFFVLLASCLIG